MAPKNNLRFVSLIVAKFAGIGSKTKPVIQYPEDVDITDELKKVEKENGLVIVFPFGYNYIEIEGDQGQGKTSLIECIKEATGGIASANTLNEDIEVDGDNKKLVLDKKYKDRFWGIDGKLYSLRVTKSTITLEQIEVDDNGEPIKNAKGIENAAIMKTPKTVLQTIVGPAGISPMMLKDMNGAEQVKWLRSLFNLNTEELKLELEIKTKYDTAYKQRTIENKEYLRLETILNNNEYYLKTEKWQKYFDETDFEKLQASVNDTVTLKANYDRSVEGLPLLKTQLDGLDKEVKEYERQIAELQIKLELKKSQHDQLEERIKKGAEWIEENKKVIDDYNAIADKIKEVNEFKVHELSFNNMKDVKKEMDKHSDESVRLTGIVDQYAQLKKDYIKKFTPEIEDFEICIKDEGETREGLFYKSRSLATLAESELWELATQLWQKMGVKIIYVENINGLGSGAVAKFNEFLKTGGAYIFGTKMNRAEDNLKISFHTEIPLKS